MNELERVRVYLGGDWRSILAFVPSSVLEEVETYKPFDCVPFDLLAYLLSFVTLKDVKSVIFTCRLCSRVPYERKHMFWKRMVAQQATFDTFTPIPCFPDEVRPVETLRQQVEWLFRGPTWRCRGTTKDKFSGEGRYNGDGHWLTVHSDGVVVYTGGYVPFFKEGVEMVQADYYPNGVLHFIHRSEIDAKTGRFYQLYSSGATYDGEFAINDDGALQPHGSGRWALKSGRVIEGEGVACRGKMVRPLKKLKLE